MVRGQGLGQEWDKRIQHPQLFIRSDIKPSSSQSYVEDLQVYSSFEYKYAPDSHQKSLLHALQCAVHTL